MHVWYHNYNTKMQKYCQEVIAFSLWVRSARRLLVFALWRKPKSRAFLKAIFVPWYMEIVSEKYIFGKSCYCFTRYKKLSWAIEKQYSKTCVRKGFLRVIYTTIARVTQAQILRRNSRLKRTLWYMASPNETTLRRRSVASTTHRPKNWGK